VNIIPHTPELLRCAFMVGGTGIEPVTPAL
jgi:hypothetical protein